MGIIVCQTCEETIEYFEDDKVSTLYAKCNCCQESKEEE